MGYDDDDYEDDQSTYTTCPRCGECAYVENGSCDVCGYDGC